MPDEEHQAALCPWCKLPLPGDGTCPGTAGPGHVPAMFTIDGMLGLIAHTPLAKEKIMPEPDLSARDRLDVARAHFAEHPEQKVFPRATVELYLRWAYLALGEAAAEISRCKAELDQAASREVLLTFRSVGANVPVSGLSEGTVLRCADEPEIEWVLRSGTWERAEKPL